MLAEIPGDPRFHLAVPLVPLVEGRLPPRAQHDAGRPDLQRRGTQERPLLSVGDPRARGERGQERDEQDRPDTHAWDHIRADSRTMERSMMRAT